MEILSFEKQGKKAKDRRRRAEFLARSQKPPSPETVVNIGHTTNLVMGTSGKAKAIAKARAKVVEYHCECANNLARESQQNVRAQYESVKQELASVEERQKEAKHQRDKLDQYRHVSWDPNKVSLKPWTPPVWARVMMTFLAIAVAFSAGIKTVSLIVLGNVTFDGEPWAAVGFGFSLFLLPSFGLAAYAYGLKGEKQTRFRRRLIQLGTTAIMIFILTFAIEYAPRHATEDLFSAAAFASFDTMEPAEQGWPAKLLALVLGAWVPTLLLYSQLSSEVCYAAWLKSELLETFREHGWPRLRARQVNPEWAVHEKLYASLSKKKTRLAGDIELAKAALEIAEDDGKSYVTQVVHLAEALFDRKASAMRTFLNNELEGGNHA